jgi:single-strand DNA-binding protein
MASLNRVFLMGNLTKDPEIRYTPSGKAVGDLRLAVNERVKQGENWVDRPVYLDVTVWSRQAETCGQYLGKGSPVMVEGRLQLDEWEDKQGGGKRSRLKVVADLVHFIGAPREGGARPARDGAPREGGARPGREAPADDRPEERPPADDFVPSPGGEGMPDEDNLPF